MRAASSCSARRRRRAPPACPLNPAACATENRRRWLGGARTRVASLPACESKAIHVLITCRN